MSGQLGLSVTVLLLIRDILTWRERQFGLIIRCVTVNWNVQIVAESKCGFGAGSIVPGRRGFRFRLSTHIWVLPTGCSSILESLCNTGVGVTDVDVVCG